jgi:hypothetical protein
VKPLLSEPKKRGTVVAKRTGAPSRTAAKSWTIMVFMVGDAELQVSANRDLLELERAGSSEDVNVIVALQETGRHDTVWIEVKPRSESPDPKNIVGRTKTGDLNERLDAFLEFVTKEPHLAARHYLLVLWGHASGLGFGRLAADSRDDIRVNELAASLSTFRKARGDEKLEILGFCACALSKAEFALELRNEVDYLVSSQVGISTLMTWPFDRLVQRALVSPSIEPEAFASQIVRVFEESYEPPPVALTALDLRQSNRLGKQVDSVSKAILDALERPDDEGLLNSLCVLRAFRNAEAAYPFELEALVDFFDFCGKLVEEVDLTGDVRQTARDVLDDGVRSFVVENTRSGPKMAALNGLSIIAPDFDDPDWAKVLERAKTDALLWTNTDWAKMTLRIHEFAMKSELVG